MQIDRDVPLPQAARCEYPFAEMHSGDSFAVPADRANTVRTAISRYCKEHQERFTTRIVMEQDQLMIRVWRIL
jgi:hypothetical protein